MSNLIWAEEHLRHNISPADRRPVRDVTTVITTRYWVDSIHESVPHPPAEYFKRRAQLFVGFTVPSVAAQTVRPDRWLVLFSEWTTELPEVKLVLDLIEELPFATALIVPEGRAFSSISRDWIDIFMRHPQRSDNWLASVRLDNDDMLANDFVSCTAQWISAVCPLAPSTVVFPIGLQVDDQEARLMVSPVNHFTITVSRRESGIYDPYLLNHTEIYRGKERLTAPQLASIYQVMTRFPMWAEILHEDNVANRPKPGPVISSDWSRFHG